MVFLKRYMKMLWLLNWKNNGLNVEAQKPISVLYENQVVGEYFADLCVAGTVIIELKAAETLSKAHETQLINYLKATGIEVGLLLNFGTVSIQVGTESLIFDYVHDPSGVQREIFRRIAERQTALRQVNLEAERDRMSQWLAAYHRRVND